MSRIGKLPVNITEGVECTLQDGNVIHVKGKQGERSLEVDHSLDVAIEDEQVIVTRKSEAKNVKALHGLYRALIQNLVIGVNEGYKIGLEVIGVGYRAAVNNNTLELSVGYSHPFYFVPPPEIELEVDTKSAKNPRVYIKGMDKELVGQVAAKIRSIRPPEPYKGKGIRYIDERVRKKAGKSAGK